MPASPGGLRGFGGAPAPPPKPAPVAVVPPPPNGVGALIAIAGGCWFGRQRQRTRYESRIFHSQPSWRSALYTSVITCAGSFFDWMPRYQRRLRALVAPDAAAAAPTALLVPALIGPAPVLPAGAGAAPFMSACVACSASRCCCA